MKQMDRLDDARFKPHTVTARQKRDAVESYICWLKDEGAGTAEGMT